MVSSSRIWNPVVRWLSPTWAVQRIDREAVGHDGETYTWTYIDVSEIRGGRIAAACRFDIDDEEAAFAYAEERVNATTSQLAVSNRATQTSRAFIAAMNANDLDGAARCFSDRWVFDDRRRLGGNPLEEVRVALARILEQYSNFEIRTLAVRGERTQLVWSRWSDDSGNETTHLHVQEVNGDGLLVYEGRFDEDDFEGAHRQLEHRYFAGEGAAFAEVGMVGAETMLAWNRGEFDRVFGEFMTPDFRLETRTQSVFGNRSAAELRATYEELWAMVASACMWNSAVCWLSPTIGVGRHERQAIGHDGEKYAWTRLYVYEFRENRFAHMCEFDVEDEEAAFAYAEERIRATSSRLVVENRATRTAQAFWRVTRAHDIDGILECCSDRIVYDDRRRISGNPIHDRAGFRAAFERILEQYNRFEERMLAVRGEHLSLASSRWLNDSGYESTYLHVSEVDDAGKIIFEGRFDGDDFEGAYRELDRRYYAGDGAAFAEAGATVTDYVIALHRGDLERAVGELSAPDFRLENRSRSVFGDRSAAEFRSGQEELNAMVTSARTFNSAMCWLSPATAISRFEREAIGRDGERYAWSFIVVSEVHGGRVARVGQFDVDDEEAAFTYAEERARVAAGRLAVANGASQASDALGRATDAADCDGVVACYADAFVFDDRRRLSGDPVRDAADLRRGIERILAQYSHFEYRKLAVRGDRLALLWSRWLDDSETKRPTCTYAKSTTTAASPTTVASTRTTSRAPTASSSGGTTPTRARRSPKLERRRPSGDRTQPG